jgi:hypothetical protein
MKNHTTQKFTVESRRFQLYNNATFFSCNERMFFFNLNLFHAVKTSPEEIQSVTLNDRRNTRLSFVKENKYKVGLNLVKNRLHSVTNVVDKKMDRFESVKL